MRRFGDWTLDRDKWLRRPKRAEDAGLIRHFNAGFVGSRSTFVRSMGIAEALDAGQPITDRNIRTLIEDRHGADL